MKYLTFIFLVLLLSATTYAVEIPNQFEDGQVTSASQMNENFQALKVEIEALKSQLSNIQAESNIQFVGFTEGLMRAKNGTIEMNTLCHNYISDSRVCTDMEVKKMLHDPNNPIPNGVAFVVAEDTLESCGTNNSGGSIYLQDRKIIYDTARMICDDWDNKVACCK